MPLVRYLGIVVCGSLCLLRQMGTVDGFNLYMGGRKRPIPSSHDRTIDRRSMISTIGSFATVPLLVASNVKSALASDANTSIKPAVNDFNIENFTVSLPSNWKVTSKPSSGTNESQKGQTPKIFSAIDLQSGSVLTVVKEQACNVQEYAQSVKSCNIVMPANGEMFSQDTIVKDITKLLIRHDDRDNIVLQGITKLDSYALNGKVLELAATTTIPSGGVYRDTMGIDRPNTIDRKVKAKSLVQSTNVLTLWLSAPLDEWQKPVMGTKLNQIWDNIQLK